MAGAQPIDLFQATQSTVDLRFQWTFRVLSSLYLTNPSQQTELESGGKVILPASALEHLSSHPHVLQRPIQFRVSNPLVNPVKLTHCGVLEFTAPLNTVYMPGWMMNYLMVADHSIVTFDRALLPKATYCKFQPQSSTFLEITNQKAMLENSLRRFACLTRGDVLAIQYNNREYKLLVQETRPSQAVSIIDCDMETEFALPADYQPPPPPKKAATSPSGAGAEGDDDEDKKKTTTPKDSTVFNGVGYRLNRKTPIKAKPTTCRGDDKDTSWKIGFLKFKR